MKTLSPTPRSLLFVLSGPCGAGKTTLFNEWRRRSPGLRSATSITTNEAAARTENCTYVSVERFLEFVSSGEFAEWVNPAPGEFYGVLRSALDANLAGGHDTVLDFVPEGFLNLRHVYGDSVIGIFVMAPDIETLRQRLAGRKRESEAVQRQRMEMARRDFCFVSSHDYHVVNADVDSTVEVLLSIQRSERARVANLEGLRDFYDAHRDRSTVLHYYQ